MKECKHCLRFFVEKSKEDKYCPRCKSLPRVAVELINQEDELDKKEDK